MIRPKQLALFVAVAFALLHSSSALASTSCVVVADVATDLRVAGQPVKLEPRVPTRFSDCEEVKSEAGTITVCYLTSAGRRTCTPLQAGKTLPATLAEQENKSVADAFRATLVAFAKGDSQTKVGQTRGGAAQPWLPYGEIVVLGDSLEITLPSTGQVDIQSLHIERLDIPGQPTLSGQLIDGKVRFSAKELVAGAKYRWRLKTAQREYSGLFQIADHGDIARLRPQVAEITTRADSQLGRSILLAELYLENGYSFNARAELVKNGLSGY